MDSNSIDILCFDSFTSKLWKIPANTCLKEIKKTYPFCYVIESENEKISFDDNFILKEGNKLYLGINHFIF